MDKCNGCKKPPEQICPYEFRMAVQNKKRRCVYVKDYDNSLNDESNIRKIKPT